MKPTNSHITGLHAVYMAAVDSCVDAPLKREVLASATSSVVQFGRWEQAYFEGQRRGETAKATKKECEDALRKTFFCIGSAFSGDRECYPTIQGAKRVRSR